MLEELKIFLTNRGWLLHRESEKWAVFKPPAELGFEESFFLYVPNAKDKPDFEAVFYSTVSLLAKIYKTNPLKIVLKGEI